MIYEVNIAFETELENQAHVNRFIKDMTDRIIPEEAGYVSHFKIEVIDTEDIDDEEED